MESNEGCGSLRRLSEAQENSSPFRVLNLECKRHVGPAGGFEGSQDSRKVLWAKSEREWGLGKLPVRGVDSEVVGINRLHKAHQAVRIRRSQEDGSAPGTSEAHRAASMASFVLPDVCRRPDLFSFHAEGQYGEYG